MLKQRLLTAAVLIPLFVFLILKLSPQAFCIVTGMIVLLGAFEWSRLMGIQNKALALIYPVVILLAIVGAFWLRIPNVLAVTFLWWLFAFVLVLLYPKVRQAWGTGVIVRGMMGFFVLVPCWIALNLIRNAEHGTYLVLFLFALIWGADSGAYFVGKKWGKTKLAPEVSPGKSWQGLAGALLTTIVIALLGLWLMRVPPQFWLAILGLSLVTVLFSVLGDLFESMLKRQAGLKDSGNILPGHGGILDRVDSLTAAAPIFALGAILLGRIFH